MNPSAVRALLAKHVADNAAGDVGFYALEERTTSDVIGEVGFGAFETGEREVGWTLAQRFWGRGYATEAVSACIAAGGPLMAAIDEENAASIAVAERVGLRRRESRYLHGRPHVVYATASQGV